MDIPKVFVSQVEHWQVIFGNAEIGNIKIWGWNMFDIIECCHI